MKNKYYNLKKINPNAKFKIVISPRKTGLYKYYLEKKKGVREMTRISISLPQHEADNIMILAHRCRMSKSEFIRMCVKYYNDNNKHKRR